MVEHAMTVYLYLPPFLSLRTCVCVRAMQARAQKICVRKIVRFCAFDNVSQINYHMKTEGSSCLRVRPYQQRNGRESSGRQIQTH